MSIFSYVCEDRNHKSKVKICPVCNGKGVFSYPIEEDEFFPELSSYQECFCRDCNGTGKIYK